MKTRSLWMALMALMTSFVCNEAYAYDIEVENADGVTIYYNYINESTELEVTYQTTSYNSYSGSVVIPEEVTYGNQTRKVKSIGNLAFYNCRGLTSVTIPNSVTSIREDAFNECSGLTSVTIPNSVTSIGDGAFSWCSGLTSVTIPNSVTSIGSSAFSGCSGLTSISVENGNMVYDSRDNCNAIINSSTNELIVGCQNTFIPNSVTIIGYDAFINCRGLTSVTIPNSVTSIGGFAFSGCSGLISVTIGNSVTSIGNSAFSYCSGLTSVVAEMTTPFAFGSSAFDEISSSCVLTVPKGTRDAYIAAGWTEEVFKGGIVEMEGEDDPIEDKTHEIVMERKYLVHHGGSYNYPRVFFEIDNKRVLSIGYYDARYWRGSYSNTINGIYIVSGDGHEESHEEWYIAPVIQDEWVTEKLIVNSDGHVQYYMDEQYMGEVFFEELKMNMQNATSMVVAIDPWGWWDGHYMYMDDFKLTIDGTVIIDDDFNDGVINLDSWQSPVNPDGVREEDGIMKMEQLRTDQDFYLRSLPIPLKSSGDDNDLDMAGANIQAGESNIVEIGLTNGHTDLVSFQMDLTLPEGVSIDKTGCALSSRITDEEQTLTIGKLESGAYRITSTSFSLTPISGNDGTLFSLKLTAEDGCIGGQATINNVIFSTSESEKVIMSDKAFDINILYKVVYKVDGEEYQTDRLVYNTPTTLADNPIKEGYTFSGWSEIPETMPAYDVEVTGSFAINYYTLTYILDGEEYKISTIAYGTAITAEDELSKEGYTFSGWSEIPKTMPAYDVEVTGSFAINYYTLTYILDGEEYKTSTIAYGSALTPEAEPTMEGYTFGGWSELPATMPNHDVEVTGRFYLYGDVNTDEAVDVVDVVDIARFVVATPSVNFREKLADLNSDNMVNIADAVTLVNHIAGDQNFVKAMTSSKLFNYDQCQLQLLSNGTKSLSFCLNGEADFTAFQFDIEVPDHIDLSAMRINGLRKDGHQLLFNKVSDKRYRVAALSLDNSVFKGNEGELLSISIDGLPTEEMSVHDILFVTKNGTGITFDALYISGTETGIANVHVIEDDSVIFDLQGRKLSKVQRGVNIVNGKKVIVNK